VESAHGETKHEMQGDIKQVSSHGSVSNIVKKFHASFATGLLIIVAEFIML
jgi:hypothetical protein